ncbi:hypothetical protein AC596_09330 [Yersinia pestis subsp. microtus bv. Hissarica]|uniref:hypothetical protein n=1 Tax=Yersinia pestis TaxID=632 RepID=UPI0006B9BDD8|nr:hypothetical protein [Yersinia pestis]KPD55389.1 hypothetical protein AC596_09330 [Yersinia pestis subsp. microtus bv. Hissarica]PCN70748.1 hypothetical protein A8V19_05610 [Yersinia pestis]
MNSHFDNHGKVAIALLLRYIRSRYTHIVHTDTIFYRHYFIPVLLFIPGTSHVAGVGYRLLGLAVFLQLELFWVYVQILLCCSNDKSL